MRKIFLAGLIFLVLSFNAQRGLPADTVWVFPIGRDIMMNPLLENNLIYCGSGKSIMYCLDANTGSVKWEFQGLQQRKAGIYHGVKTSKTSVFYNNGSSAFYCLNKETGKMKWQFNARFDDDIITNIILTEKGIVFSGADTIVNCLDQESGKILWQYKHNSLVFPVEGNEKTIYFTTKDSLFISLDAKTGKENWKINLSSQPENLKICYYENTAAYSNKWGKIELIDLEKHKQIKTIDPCLKPRGEYGDHRIIISHNENLFVLTGEGIKTYNLKNAEQKWDYPGKFDWYLEPTIEDGKFYIYGRMVRKLIVLDLKTGKELRVKPIDGKTYTKLLVNDKYIFLGMEGRYAAIPK